ncbi:ribosomal-protein-alanine acetyltransferase [Ventosimonas gracilis]|uniref:[Ribosomal protein bS18]-alanine N-acetyltransferase n=1 Tax=Ventosimonas gracilis TaxID=1680762 RepID=A0A139SWZ3_9GAMM|nr:ribosomal protein S18-alanine N-acetyltransferase [Ventosimonas gracilis]KXU39145.1 ribosomal-protein-alanine acetyltransferase [Ventosimonas gracilis]
MTEPSTCFRPMQEADLPTVLDIERSAFSHPWTRKLFLDSLKNHQCWLILNQEGPVGHGIISLILDEAHLLNLCIKPQHQRSGLGLALLEKLLDEARAKGARECFLEVRQSHQSAQRLYHRCGFNEVGRRHDYYPKAGGFEDALVMACALLD